MKYVYEWLAVTFRVRVVSEYFPAALLQELNGWLSPFGSGWFQSISRQHCCKNVTLALTAHLCPPWRLTY